MKKIVIIPIIAILVIIIGFSFIPILEQYQLYKWDTKTDELLGEGQKFTDAAGKRCLMSETIAGDKCPIGSRGYNPDTKVYDTGVSGMAQLNAKLGGYSDPYDPSSIDRMDAMLGIPQQQEQIRQQAPEPEDAWLGDREIELEQYIINGECDKIKEFYSSMEDLITYHELDEIRIQVYNQGIKEYKEAYQEFCE